MKLTDRRFYIFEGMMLICGIAASCLYALSFGISVLAVPSVVMLYILSYFFGGMIAWKAHKSKSGWKLAGNVFLLSMFMYLVFDILIHLSYPSPYEELADGILRGCLYWLFCAILPMSVFALIAKRILRL